MIFQRLNFNTQLFKQSLNKTTPVSTLCLLSAFFSLFVLPVNAIAEQETSSPSTTPTQIENKSSNDGFVNYGPKCLQPYEANYKTKIFGMSVESKRTLKKADGLFHAEITASSFVSEINEKSTFNYSRNRVQPLKYSFKRSGLGSSKDTRIDFNWKDKKAIYTFKGKKHTSTLHNNKVFQDQMSYQHQLCFELNKNIDIDTIEFKLPYKNRHKSSLWKNEGIETINTKLGKLDAVKLSRIRDDNERTTVIWLAKDYEYILLRLEQNEDDDEYTLEISNAKISGKPIKL